MGEIKNKPQWSNGFSDKPKSKPKPELYNTDKKAVKMRHAIEDRLERMREKDFG